MKFIADEKEINGINLVGGKGHHLQKLVSWNAPVAPFFVITTEVYEYFKGNKKLPSKVSEHIENFVKKFSKVALRSSMIGEDHKDASFAGLFETILDVNIESWETSLIKIYESVNSDRVREYLDQKKLEINLSMAVVCQAQIDVEKSGVIFTRSPVFPTSALAIDAAFGMGEGVVSGLVQVDTYKITRSGDIISHEKQNEKTVLTKNEIDELKKISLGLEKKQGAPSDIEWGYSKGKLYVFQIRPITMTFSPLKKLVDTNLSESYPGVVSPLTSQFVKLAYTNVFRESAVFLGAKGRRLKLLNFHYENLIENVDNHLYYNLEHYYAVLRALPGGEKNIINWHKMIGGKIDGMEVPYHQTELSFFETLKTMVYLGWIFKGRKKVFSSLIHKFSKKKLEIEEEISKLGSSQETIQYLKNLLKAPLGFGLTVVNDVFIMIGLGLLSSILKKKKIQDELIIEILKTTEGVDSVKPLEALNELIEKLSDDFISAYLKLDLSPGLHPYENISQALIEKGFKSEVHLLLKFLNQFGDRSFEELKLESLPLKNNPQLLIDLMKWAKELSGSKIKHNEFHEDLKFSWWERKIITFTRESIAVREATRLWRGRFYNLFRQIVLKLREDLMKEDESFKTLTVKDVFSLSAEEWFKFSKKTLSLHEVHALIEKRKKWQTQKKNFPEAIEWSVDEELFESELITEVSGELRGQGVSPGVVEGVALVLENPTDALCVQRNDFILVTKNTDPAWVYIMSRSRGLISEKGSLLSHTAIIGRELGIPTIVGVKNATSTIKNGDKLLLDSKLGTIKVL